MINWPAISLLVSPEYAPSVEYYGYIYPIQAVESFLEMDREQMERGSILSEQFLNDSKDANFSATTSNAGEVFFFYSRKTIKLCKDKNKVAIPWNNFL